ncbi:MAG: hypothetical protein AAGJ82_14830 [Bacteroidota bacterium]
MKWLILSCCCTLSLTAFGQLDLMELPRYKGAYIGLGPRSISADPGTLLLRLTDNNTGTVYFTETEVDDLRLGNGLQLGWRWGNYTKLSHDVLIDLAFGEAELFLFGYSLGWNFSTQLERKRLVIRPAIQGLISNVSFDLGTIQHTDDFVAFGETKIYNEFINVDALSEHVLLAARLDFSYRVLPKLDLFLKLAYDFEQGNDQATITLSPQGMRDERNEGRFSEKLDLTASDNNPQLLLDNQAITTLPYYLRGLRLTFGVAQVIERRRRADKRKYEGR